MGRLKQISSVVVEEMDDELLLYRPTTHKAIHLNSMAATIWKLCDGTRTINDIVDCLAGTFPNAKVGIRHDVQQVIDQLLRDGALIEQSPETTG